MPNPLTDKEIGWRARLRALADIYQDKDYEEIISLAEQEISTARTSERERLRKVVEGTKWDFRQNSPLIPLSLKEYHQSRLPELSTGYNLGLSDLLSRLQEPDSTASRAREALVKSAEGRLEDNQLER